MRLSRELKHSYPIRDEPIIYGWRAQSKRAHLNIRRAENSTLWDQHGQKFIDFGSGQINVNVGYNHPEVVSAIRDQLEKISYVAPYFATDARLNLCARIIEHMPGDLNFVFLCNGGSDAVETALKISRSYTGRQKILSAWQSYHGATAGASSVSGDARRLMAEPTVPGVVRFDIPGRFNPSIENRNICHETASALKNVEELFMREGAETIAAIIIEPIVGTSGLYVVPSDFLLGLKQLCMQFGALLIADETMSGWGRSGKWFACDHIPLVPDILVTAKGITSGYVPLGAVVVRPDIRDAFAGKSFVGGLTTEGHALACAAGLANINIYEKYGLIDRSAKLGGHVIDRLNLMMAKYDCILDVRGMGLFSAIEVCPNKICDWRSKPNSRSSFTIAERLFEALLAQGVATITKGNLIFVAPPLTIPLEDLEFGLQALDTVFSDLAGLK